MRSQDKSSARRVQTGLDLCTTRQGAMACVHTQHLHTVTEEDGLIVAVITGLNGEPDGLVVDEDVLVVLTHSDANE